MQSQRWRRLEEGRGCTVDIYFAMIFCILQFDAFKDVDNNDLSLACLKVLEARCSIKARPSSEHVSEILLGAKKGCT